MVLLALCFLFLALNLVHCGDPISKKDPDPKHVREWMSAETDFYKLEQELRKALGDEWDSFRLYMSEKIQEHHSMQQVSCQVPTTGAISPPPPPSPKPYDDCNGQAGLTESEYILHQAIDLYGKKLGDGTQESVHRYHNMAHNVFERTRKLLEKMSLLQGSEYEDAAVSKQHDMRFRYKRMTPIVVPSNNGTNHNVTNGTKPNVTNSEGK